jgi:hypothetical protein
MGRKLVNFLGYGEIEYTWLVFNHIYMYMMAQVVNNVCGHYLLVARN